MSLENEIGFSSFRNDWQKASISILYTYGMLSNGHESFFKGHGLTMQQYNALNILCNQFPKPVSTSFLREKMLDKMSDASRLVSRLCAKGLVVVNPNPSDKRLVNILISEDGRKLVSSIRSEISQLDNMMQGLTEEEAQQLVVLLEKVRESVKTVNKRIVMAQEVDA